MDVKLNDLLGKKFVPSDGVKKDFYNCWQCCREIYTRYGIELPFHYLIDAYDSEGINDIVQGHKVSNKWLKLDKPEVPCIVTIKFNSPKFVNHVGVYVGDGYFMHCREKVGVCRTSIDSPAWRNNIEGYYRYIG